MGLIGYKLGKVGFSPKNRLFKGFFRPLVSPALTKNSPYITFPTI